MTLGALSALVGVGCGSHVTVTRPAAPVVDPNCAQLDRFTDSPARPVARLPSSLVLPPLPADVGERVGAILPPLPANHVYLPNTATLAVGTPGTLTLVVVGDVPAGRSVQATHDAVVAAASARGWTAITTARQNTGSHEQMSGFEIHYSGGGHQGTETVVSCPGQPLRLVAEQTRAGTTPPP